MRGPSTMAARRTSSPSQPTQSFLFSRTHWTGHRRRGLISPPFSLCACMSMPLLDGKVAIVTGGGRGIGRAIAAGLAAAGASVLITAARNSEELAATATGIRSVGGRILTEQADVACEADCRGVVARAQDELGGLDILVNNAGRGYRFVLEANRDLPEAERLKFWNTPPEIW